MKSSAFACLRSFRFFRVLFVFVFFPSPHTVHLVVCVRDQPLRDHETGRGVRGKRRLQARGWVRRWGVAPACLALLVAALFGALAWGGQVQAAAPLALSRPVAQEPNEPVSVAAMAGVTFTLRVQSASVRPTLSATVVNNEQVTYTLALTNNSGGALAGLRFETVLPASGLANVACVTRAGESACVPVTATVDVINQLGVPVPVTVTRELVWNLGSVATGQVRSRIFTARVNSQVGGAAIENTALAFSGGQSAVSRKVTLRLQPDVPNLEATGPTDEIQVSANPNWFSGDLGGTLDMDWGDVDTDGDLDLALASTGGTKVYLNDEGLLTLVWTDPQARQSYGVRWIDTNNDGTPELVVVGQPNGATGGLNYVFRFNPGNFQAPDRFVLAPSGTFATVNQLTRIEAGEFNGDNLPDLLVSVNAISAVCPVFMLYNLGAQLYTGAPRCVSSAGSAAMSVADADRDGDHDAVLGIFPNQVRVFINRTGVLTQTDPINNIAQVDAAGYFLPYDFAWGDIDSDGDLDLAAAFPLQREVRIYRTTPTAAGGMSFTRLEPNLNTGVFLTPYAVEFGDMDHDGLLDLIVADAQPRIYPNTAPNPATNINPYSRTVNTAIAVEGERGEIWSLRAIDQDGDGALELALANRSGPSLLLANYTPPLADELTVVPGSGAANSVAWGDADNDGFSDLLFGSPAARNQSRLYFNRNGRFLIGDVRPIDVEVTGAHVATLGDIDGDLQGATGGGRLDLMLVTPVGVRLARNGGAPSPVAGPSLAGAGRAAALGDVDGDGDLDLAASATTGPLHIIENRFDESTADARSVTPAVTVQDVRSLSWGDINGDHYLDLAVASATGNRSQLLLSRGNITFVPFALEGVAAQDCRRGDVREIAWGDVDGDGDNDLALATARQRSCVLLNVGSGFTPSLSFGQDLGPITDASTVDWGDWDSDGDMDLALGRDNGEVRVYANFNGVLKLLWLSQAPFRAAGVRFGDVDNDGDMDLALAQTDAAANSGYFLNRIVTPTHLGGSGVPSLLVSTSAYVNVTRPGLTRTAYLYSSSEVLASPSSPTVTLGFRLYDPDGEAGDPPRAVRVLVEYAPTGSDWRKATPAAGQSNVYTATLTSAGDDFTFRWNAGADKPIGENARVRVAVLNPPTGVQVQAAAGVSISPPFQVRATSCIWPADPIIIVNSTPLSRPEDVFRSAESAHFFTLRFRATLREGSGAMRFYWDFGDGKGERVGQQLTQTYLPGRYTVTLRAVGENCPIAREARFVATVDLQRGIAMLPLVMRNGGGGSSAAQLQVAAETQARAAALAAPEPAPGNVAALAGSVQNGQVALNWSPPTQGGVPLETRIYVEALDGLGERRLEATLPAVVTSYTTAQGCGVLYTVVAANGGGEGPAEAYFALPCGEGGRP